MSASNKKKLRKEQASDLLTARQRQEQADAKKLKTQTITFLAIMLAVICAAVGILGVRAVNNSGIIQKNTVAANVGDREINSVELSYYYIDGVNQFYNEMYEYYGDNTETYLTAMGLDTTLPLNEQVYDKETGDTWADYFVDEAINKAASDYAMYDLAMADESFKLSEDEEAAITNTMGMLETYALIYGYEKADQYLRACYGYGSDEDSYEAYYKRTVIASAYHTGYEDTFTYTAEERAEYEADKKNNFNSYDYTSAYMSYTYFLEECTDTSEGHDHSEHTEEQNKAAREAMEAAAKDLATATSVEELEKKAAEIKVTGENKISVTKNLGTLHTSINATLSDWLADPSRQNGDIAAIPNESTSTDDAGNETTVVNGYYVAIFQGRTDNATAMADMGYIYVPYEGGKEDEDSGEIIYTDEEKSNTRKTVEGFLSDWEAGEKTEASMEELANKLIEEEKATSGGLAENINTDSDFDEAIMNWILDSVRVAGDTTIVEADEGFYLLYYSGKSELDYRQFMIESEMRAADYQKWYDDAVAAVSTSVGNTSKMDLDMVLGG